MGMTAGMYGSEFYSPSINRKHSRAYGEFASEISVKLFPLSVKYLQYGRLYCDLASGEFTP